MVGHAADLNGLHPVLARDAAQKRPEPFAQRRRDQRPAFLGAEHAMVIRTDV
ncbi:MAG: hypothetical protein JWQ04_550 [Pedosphaera sp.]|nr:hypothetical protein [Pedosphaera sp.]